MSHIAVNAYIATAQSELSSHSLVGDVPRDLHVARRHVLRVGQVTVVVLSNQDSVTCDVHDETLDVVEVGDATYQTGGKNGTYRNVKHIDSTYRCYISNWG